MKRKSINSIFFIQLISLLALLASCSPSTERTGVLSDSQSINTSGSVDKGFGRVLKDNPIVLSGNEQLPENPNLNSFLPNDQVYITNNSTLKDSCALNNTNSANCLETYLDANKAAIDPINNRWTFDANSTDFLQVQTFYYSKYAILRFHQVLYEYYYYFYPNRLVNTALPKELYTLNAQWNQTPLKAYAYCGSIGNNSAFNPATFSTCLGYNTKIKNFAWSQDKDVILHETTHSIVQISQNLRNRNSTINPLGLETNLGVLYYDEAGAINEGIADFGSYINGGGTRFAEWAAGRFFHAARPLTESDTLHISAVNTSTDSRLAYPQYLNYDPNAPTTPIEDIHQNGQIISHFLVNLTKSIMSECSFNETTAQNYVYYALIDSLSLSGDLSAKGNDYFSTTINTEDRINLTQNNDLGNVSKMWSESIHPINYRKLPQLMGRFMLKTPPCTNYTQSKIETNWDMYGLLLFSSFNDNLNGINTGHNTTTDPVTKVNPLNRKRSVLIPKNLLKLTTQVDATKFYIFDGQKDILAMVNGLQATGTIGSLSPNIPNDLSYNNNNGLISPGEVVGILPHLYNASNSTMGGIQIFSNDWDHAKKENGQLRPCNNFSDAWPKSFSAGAASSSATPNSPTTGDCEYITKTNGTAPSGAEPMAPVCFVQIKSSNQTQWVDQETFRQSINLQKKECLQPNSAENANDPNYDCFIRAIKGAHHSYYSKIEPNKNWAQSVSPNGNVQFFPSHLLLFEVNSWIPPGTTFECRFRARFTNCNECFQDNTRTDLDDYLDYEYSGATPFNIIHYQFTVVN